MAAVPLKEYIRADGSLNLASNFPENTIKPDLGMVQASANSIESNTPVGPKMYIALEDHNHVGSTRLHMDLSDAINLLTYASPSSTGKQGGALWHIFSREHTARLSEILKTHRSYSGVGNPIHEQSIYLTSSDLEELARHGIIPYIIIQRSGQAILIPAGCAHQVCDLSIYLLLSRSQGDNPG